VCGEMTIVHWAGQRPVTPFIKHSVAVIPKWRTQS